MLKRLDWKIIIIIGIVMLSLIAIGFYYTDEIKPTKLPERNGGARVVTVAAANSGAPYLYVSASGKEIGYNVDVLALLSEKLDMEFQFVEANFDETMGMIDNNEIDLILGLQYNPAYVDKLKYSKPFIDNESRVFVKATTTNLNSFSDLEGKKVVIYKNDPSFNYLSSLNGIRIFKTESLEDAATMLRYGTVDAWVGNYRESILLLKNSVFSGSIKMVGTGVETFPSAMAAQKSEEELIDTINEGIDLIKNSEELLAIENKWFGEIIESNNPKLQNYLYITLGIVVSLSVLVLIIIRINKLLKNEVDKRTREIENQKKLSEGMLQSLSDGVLTVDSKKRIIFMNEKLITFRILDLTKKSIGQKIEVTGLSKIININHIEKCIHDQEKIIGAERRIRFGNRDTEIYEYSITPIMLPTDGGNTVPGATIAIRDNTEVVVLKERMMSIDKLQSIGRMTAGVAHELRNPLTSIDMYIKVLPQKYDNEEFRKMMIKDLSNEISRVNMIVDNLLDMSKVKKPKVEKFALSKEIMGIIRLVKMQTNTEKLNFIQQIDDRIMIKFDKNQFTQVCVNILSNAIEKLENENGGQIKVTAAMNRNRVDLSFEDSGSMIPEEIIESIFEPFYTTKEIGNGLGLSIVYELVSKNEGVITAYNSEEQKPTFKLTLKGGNVYD